MKKTTKTMILALTFCCMSVIQGKASNVSGRISLSSAVRAGGIQAGRSSIIKMGSAKLKGSRIGGPLTVNSEVRIGGKTSIGRNGLLSAGSFAINNGYVGGPIDFQTDVSVGRGVYGDQGNEIGIGGVQITADKNYNPQKLPAGSSLYLQTGRLSGQSLQNSSFLANLKTGASPRSFAINIDDSSPNKLGDRFLLFSKMSEKVYGNTSSFPGWIRIYDTNLGKTKADRKLRQSGGHAIVYKNKKTGEITTVFEGTKAPSLKNTVKFLKDLDDDGLQRIAPTGQYKAAVNVLENVWNANPKAKMIVTGHSLGGGLAQYAGAKLAINHSDAKIEGVVFNTADLGLVADAQLLLNRNKLDGISMSHIRINGDTVSASAGLNVRAVFPNSVEYELPSNDGVWSDHGIAVIIEKIKGHQAELNQQNINTKGKVNIGKS